MISPSDNNLFVTEMVKVGDKTIKCKVLAAGKDVKEVKEGDEILIDKGKAVEIFYGGEYYHSVSKSFIISELQ